jgi:hypothetical protein
MSQLGGAGTASRVEGSLERGGASREGLGPSSKAGTRPRRRQALEQGGGFVMRCLPLERDRGSPEGRRGRFVGPLRLFGPWAFLCLGLRPCGAWFVVAGLIVYYYYLKWDDFFRCYDCPRRSLHHVSIFNAMKL